jgi:hypothetical protein
VYGPPTAPFPWIWRSISAASAPEAPVCPPSGCWSSTPTPLSSRCSPPPLKDDPRASPDAFRDFVRTVASDRRLPLEDPIRLYRSGLQPDPLTGSVMGVCFFYE